MDENAVLIDRRAGYRVFTLNRPQRLNAFNDAMHQSLAAAITDAERDQECAGPRRCPFGHDHRTREESA